MTNHLTRRVAGVSATLGLLGLFAHETAGKVQRTNDVVAGFDLGSPKAGPFPSDAFTVPDARHNTGRRIALPYPDCGLRPSDCDDLDVLNTLDGWGLQSRISIPFSGDIDPASVTSQAVFVVSLGSTRQGHRPGGERVGINQAVWDVATHTLHVEVGRLLEQHRRYAVIVTSDVRDTRGRKVKRSATFERYLARRGWYARALRDALQAAHQLGVPPGQVVTASVFTTQTITTVMERIRDEVKAAIPAPADFLLGPAGERTVFPRSEVASVVFRQQTAVNPVTFANMNVNLAQLDAVPGAVGTIAYGRYSSPSYLLPGGIIPAVGTLAETPLVQGTAGIYFTLYLPSGPRPPGGWPVVLAGGGATGNQHVAATIPASMLARHGLASIAISYVGQGLGPLGRLLLTRTNGTSINMPDAGRGVDQNGDGVYSPLEGSEAAAPLTWAVSIRDTNRQSVIDLMQLVRVIQVGMDVDGDGLGDLDPDRIYFEGVSLSGMSGVSFVALDPGVAAAAFVATPGLIPEHVRWQPVRRSAMGTALQDRVPSLINTPGISSIDGVPVGLPHFDENKPLRDQPPVVNTVAGAMEIQQALERAEMAAEGIGPVPWARHLHVSPLPGSYPKSILVLMAKGDQNAVNPGTSAILREGALENRTTLYRNDLAFADDPAVPKGPHLFSGSPPVRTQRSERSRWGRRNRPRCSSSRSAERSMHPAPAQSFEVPITGALPEALDFIP